MFDLKTLRSGKCEPLRVLPPGAATNARVIGLADKLIVPEERLVTGNGIRVTPHSIGNITPYRKDLMEELKKHWEAGSGKVAPVLLVEIAKNGSLVRVEVLESSGDTQRDHSAEEAVQKARFTPLPDWYRGESIPFKIDFAKVRE